MRYSHAVAILFCAMVWGQAKPPLGILRAELHSWTGSWDGGQLQLRLDSGLDYECHFNSKTFFDRDRSRISVGRLRPGDNLEIVSDRTSVGGGCFARMVKVVSKLSGEPANWGQVTRVTEHFAPRGNLLYSGTVAENNGDGFVLRIRTGERLQIRLRSDTRFVQNGLPSSREILLVNGVVFVRAGMGLSDEIEAYQVVAGEILQPGKAGTRLQ